MSSPNDIATRIWTLTAVLPDPDEQQAVETAVTQARGDWAQALQALTATLSPASITRLTLAYTLADWSGDHVALVGTLVEDPAITGLRDVALNYNVPALAAALNPEDLSPPTPGASPDEIRQHAAVELRRKLFAAEPTAVLQRMVADAEIPTTPAIRDGVGAFLSNLPDLNLRVTSVYTAFRQPDAFNGIVPDDRAAVTDTVKALQRVLALSPPRVPEAVPALMNTGLTSAFSVAQIPESNFVRALGPALGEENARLVHTNAMNTQIRNEQALASMRETVRGSGLAIIDGAGTLEDRVAAFAAAAENTGAPVNLHDLFGSIDRCECDDCLSIYSPAAYFVELLQFLRNNNLDPNATGPTEINPDDPTNIDGTPLQMLFKRRPDLKCLELTCENTFTVLPYIDLANEVMESFVVHLGDYAADPNKLKQATLDVFNVGDETTTELLAQPQHVNYQAYCILKNAVYPFTLPYNQPINVARVWLAALGTSRYELLDTFRTATETCAGAKLTSVEQAELDVLHAEVYERATDAEYLGITQEEYIILTREAFWKKRYFELTTGSSYTDEEYRAHVGVKPVHDYYGYTTDDDMLDTDETAGKGLTFVAAQFLPRTGIHYPDLVDLVRTRFVNPALPTGEALTLMDAIAFSYRFLLTLVDTTSSDPAMRFGKLIAFLNTHQSLVPEIEAILHPDPCHQLDPCHSQPPCGCGTAQDFTNWVECYFDRIGQLIVLDSGGPRLPIEGTLVPMPTEAPTEAAAATILGTLYPDGRIVGPDGKTLIGQVVETPTGAAKALTLDSNPFNPARIFSNDHEVARINPDGTIIDPELRAPIHWTVQELCDLDTVRLTHLDGTALTVPEYDRIHRFIRLWRKLGWTIEQTDQALVALSAHPSDGSDGGECEFVSFETFQDSPEAPGSNGAAGAPGACPDIPPAPDDISPVTIHQLAAIRHLLDTTGLELDKALVLWGDIGTTGNHPLYARLFLTHNVLGIDPVFRSDSNGNFLTGSIKLSDHLPVVMAALTLMAADIAAIVADHQLPDALTLKTVSTLYRYVLLAGLLHVRVSELPTIVTVLGDPFTDPQTTREFLQTWQDMQDAGLTYRQLDYLIRNHDDPLHPVGPSQRTILQVTKALYDGLTAIANDHPDPTPDQITDDLIRASAALLYDPTVVDQIVGLVEGTTVHTTNAPTGLTVTIPPALASRLKYSDQSHAQPPAATIQITGILTAADTAAAKTLSADPGWSAAIDRAGKQAGQFFHNVLADVFPPGGAAEKILLAGDDNPPPDSTNPAPPGTAAGKREAFLQGFLPYLRTRLAHKLIVDTASAAVGLTTDTTDLLLSNVLRVGTNGQSGLEALQNVAQSPAGGSAGWRGYLTPTTTAAYTFVAVGSDTQPAALSIDGTPVAFRYQQDDPSNVWSTDPITLSAGTLYWLDTGALSLAQLQWKTPTSLPTPIPAGALLPDHSTQDTTEVFTKLTEAALLVNGFALSTAEVTYLQAHPSDFDCFDFNATTLTQCKRLHAYTTLRGSLTSPATTLIDLFGWVAGTSPAPNPADLPDRIAAATGWTTDSITALLSPQRFNLDRPEAFRNETHLVMLQKAIGVTIRSTVSVERLFSWANPTSSFWPTHTIAADIQAALRARYNQSDWEQVVKPLYDQLRANQRDALIAYLLIQPPLRDWGHGAIDADGLFEFFLLDVQMGACLETSRIKQAISSVQSFVQRCLLGLEADYGVAAGVLDRTRWEWMQKYRVWEANRKVFAYPENWLNPTLRDDASPLFTQLQSALLQKDINPATIEDALHGYVTGFDAIANLQPAGLFVEETQDQHHIPMKLHVFARTRSAPQQFYYRYYDIPAKYWYPWQPVTVDISSYDVENEDTTTGKVTLGENGTYLIPVVFNGRLLVFFPQFRRKSATPPVPIGDPKTGRKATFQEIGNAPASDRQSIPYWEIVMASSELRNGTWLQKQVSTGTTTIGALMDSAASGSTVPPDISQYRFVPRIVAATENDPAMIVIDAYRQPDTVGLSAARSTSSSNRIGGFQFAGNHLVTVSTATVDDTAVTDFHYLTSDGTTARQLHSLQGVEGTATLPYAGLNTPPYFAVSATDVTAFPDPKDSTASVTGADRFAHQLVGALARDGVDGLFAYYLNNVTSTDEKTDVYGGDGSATNPIYHELARPYSLYHWEIGFHALTLLVDRLLAAGQFDLALQMIHHILNPFAAGTTADPVWGFAPFRDTDAQHDLEKLFLSLKANQPDPSITDWRNYPFQPYAVARHRIGAYMRWVAMTYIRIWIAYGDYYFRQNTLETLPLAIQCYVVASHVYGPRGETIPKRGKTLPQTYASLLDKWDAFSNAMVELELVFPFSNQTPLPLNTSNGVVGLANIFGFATTLYFCIPDNPDLTALRDTIDDRLFKIRHCQDINGVQQQLPLFEPPIEPGLLVQAAAQGLSLATVLTDLNSPTPNYRFAYLLQKALELCGELKTLGNALLSAREKHDAEALAQLRAGHETTINTLIMQVRKQQADEADKALTALQESRKSPVYRLQHQLKLIGADLAAVPADTQTEFTELPDQIDAPQTESGLKLSSFEKEDMDKASTARDLQAAVGAVETLASVFHAIPSGHVHATPIGVGAQVQWGGPNLGNLTQAVARGLQIGVNDLNFQSSNARSKAGYQRQLQERVQAANVAGYEITNIDKQILTQQIRQAIAAQEITNQQQQIDNSQAVEEFLRSKYSNTELYAYMDTQIRSLYYQTYTLAYDLAKKAEKLFYFERGVDTPEFIQFGYWDPARDGLLAGENLYNGLKKLEGAYQEKRGYDFEVTKPVSLRQIDPLALMDLRDTGTCEFAFPEVLFDMDYPGHYQRRIKSVAITIPAVVGPYTCVNATLRLLEHTFRTTPLATNKNAYPRTTDNGDSRFTTVNVPITAIAVSAGQNDSGLFELNFRDERYLPFEGAGAISKWRLELPTDFRQFDYDTITDVVVQLRYTALDGGDKLQQIAAGSVQDYLKSVENLSRTEGLFAAFDLPHEFPDEWYKATHAQPIQLTLANLYSRLPIFTRGRDPQKIQAADVYLYTAVHPTPAGVILTQAGNDTSLAPVAVTTDVTSFQATGLSGIAMDTWQITFSGTNLTFDKVWLVVRYVLT